MGALRILLTTVGTNGQEPLRNYADDETLWVAVLGLTGSGKSTFIQRATSNENIVVCHGLDSCTSIVDYFRTTVHTKSGLRGFALIDTPGFDDSKKDDLEVLEEIANGLASLYGQGIRLSAVVYVHRISDNRQAGSAMRSVKVLKEMLGPENFDITWLATSHWGETPYDKAVAREAQLIRDKEKWGDLIAKGARTIRLEDKHKTLSARDLLRKISARAPEPRVLAIQKEMVDQKIPFSHTTAVVALEGWKYVEYLMEGVKQGHIPRSELPDKLLEFIKAKVKEKMAGREASLARMVVALRGGSSMPWLIAETALKLLMPQVATNVLSFGVEAFGLALLSLF